MSKGLTLVETIIYISLLSILVVGIFSSVFSEIYMSTNKPKISDTDYQNLIENFHE